MPSPFLHASSSLKAVRGIIEGRRWLYSNWIVGFLKDCVGPAMRIDFGDKPEWGWVLNECDGDTDFLHECLQKARGYTEKDRELVYLTSILLKGIDWWCERTTQWRNAEETAAWKPVPAGTPPPVNRIRPFAAATSQAASSQSAAQSVQASMQ